jgi:hypothetical protein
MKPFKRHPIKNRNIMQIMGRGRYGIHPPTAKEIRAAVRNFQMILPKGTVSFSRGQTQWGGMKKGLAPKSF